MNMHMFFILWLSTLIISVTIYVVSGSWVLGLISFVAMVAFDIWASTQ